MIDTSLPPQAYVRAYELVGEFLYHFSRLEEQLNMAIAQLFKLDEPAAQILTSSIDFAKKVSIVQAAVTEQNASPDQKWLQRKIKSTFKAVFAVNTERQVIAHSAFEPGSSGGVQFRRTTASGGLLKNVDPHWDEAKFAEDYQKMKKLEPDLAGVLRHIRPYVPAMDFTDPRNSGYIALLT